MKGKKYNNNANVQSIKKKYERNRDRDREVHNAIATSPCTKPNNSHIIQLINNLFRFCVNSI